MLADSLHLETARWIWDYCLLLGKKTWKYSLSLSINTNYVSYLRNSYLSESKLDKGEEVLCP